MKTPWLKAKWKSLLSFRVHLPVAGIVFSLLVLGGLILAQTCRLIAMQEAIEEIHSRTHELSARFDQILDEQDPGACEGGEPGDGTDQERLGI